MTNWKFTDQSHRAVMRTNADGSQESCLVSAIADWLAGGNTPEPEEQPDPNIAIQAQIDQLERDSMLNRGSRELQLFLMEERASQVAAARGVPAAAILAANIYYSKLKPLDDQISALREQIK